MRRLAALLILAIACATPAGAQNNGRIQVVKPTVNTAGLRGTAGEPGPGAARSPNAPLADLAPAPPPVAPAAARSSIDAGQCRKACAREYYFCLSADDESSCSPVWVKCQARCGA